ncbi:unnamed protein product [Vitrella brassicaformis CCMP3155]|uniref:Cytoplasmic dynein 2 light intermediate chain 1 n=1 Tax=Vitrella brassicaformis (strain CCMP3155) TaxID=1169540 RepID=A0A0G4EHE0_VITBC|nr:unnamed protein product [Vitrella brassicaformis CCMP3155]|eukprot:CEL95911.1 unnamed protein product [Vitrella brassicaformis CCMP3155]
MATATASRRKPESSLPAPAAVNLWAQLEKHQRSSLQEQKSSDVTVVVCGRKRSGKTSLVDRFINQHKDPSQAPNATVGIDYKYARQPDPNSNRKTVAHFFDIGGDERLEALVSCPLSGSSIEGCVLVVVVDMAKPHSAFGTLQHYLKLIQGEVERCRLERVAAGGAVETPGVHTIVCLAKWDLFADAHEPERRKWLCRALRYLCVSAAPPAGLVSTSVRDKTSIMTFRSMLKHCALSGPAIRASAVQREPMRPLCIPSGTDSLDAIGPPPNAATHSAPQWERVANEYFPPSETVERSEAAVVSVDLDKYAEPLVNAMAEQKREELKAYLRQVERRQRLREE